MLSRPGLGREASGVLSAQGAVAFAVLFETHRRSISQFVGRVVSARSEVEDVCSDVFLVAFRRFEELADLSELAAQSWLFRVAELLCLKGQRSRCRRDRAYGRVAATYVADDVPADEAYLRHAKRSALSDRVEVVLASLHPSHRSILLEYMDADGPSGRLLAEALGVTHVAVRVRLTRAKRAFRAEYQRVFGDPEHVTS